VQKVLFEYTGPTFTPGGVKVAFYAAAGFMEAYEYPGGLFTGTTVEANGQAGPLTAENGYTIDATFFPPATNLGATTMVTVTPLGGGGPLLPQEVLQTDCSKTFAEDRPAPLAVGGLSPNWHVLKFVQE
jgi:hypothetical protein